MRVPGSKSRTIPAMWTGNVDASNVVIGPTPLRPAMNDDQVVEASLPIGVTAPIPVITTRRWAGVLDAVLAIVTACEHLESRLARGDLTPVEPVGAERAEPLRYSHH